MNDPDLTADQTDKIVQFQDLTGIDNLSVCRDALQRHQWDLEVAVQDQLNISEGRPSVFAASETATPPNVINDGVVQHIFYSPPSGYPRWGGPIGCMVSFVFQFCYNTFMSILKFAFSIFWREPRRQVTDPVGDVLKFIDTVNENYSRNHPVFYQGSYGQALNDAKQELRFLVVYLHQENNQDCANFCRESLSNEAVIDYINSNALFWGCTTSSGEGDRVCHTLKASTFPFLGVIVYKESRMTLVARMEGPTDAHELLTRLTAVFSLTQNYLEMARQERISRSLTQRIRREQDAAYLESLRVDQEKERRKNEEQEKKMQALREQEEREQAERDRKESIKRAKIEMASDIPDEPESSHPDALSIVFKLPSGERIERRFLKTHKLKDVYNFVFCHPSSPDVFQIATNFPKRVLETETAPEKHLTEAGLSRSEVLFVYDLEA